MPGVIRVGLPNLVTPSVGGAVGGVFPAGAASAFPLDDAPSAVLGFSIARVLKSDYIGSPLIRVRRSSDDAEQDIGSVVSGRRRVLDTASLESFAGMGDAFITTVYEQSGHAAAVDYAQTTAALQPQIVASGTTITKDGKVAMRQPTVGAGAEYITLSAWNTRPSAAVVMEVWSAPAARSYVIAISTGSGSIYSLACEDASASTTLAQNSGASQTWSKNGSIAATNGVSTRDTAHSAFCNGVLNIVRHNEIDLSSTSYSAARTEYSLSTAVDGPEYWSEQIITDTAEVAALESNIADFYGIALA